MTTVDEAITRGKRMITLPVIFILLGGICLCCWVGIEKILPMSGLIGCIALAIVAPWLYWSVMITKWRLWAFENVRNVHELKQRAIMERLIWPDGSFFEKTEIRSVSEREKWQLLQYRFNSPDVFEDDTAVPPETIVRYSKPQSYFVLCMGLGMVVLGFVLYDIGDRWLTTGAIAVIGVFMFINGLRNALNRKPQITLNALGLTTQKIGFQPWEAIVDQKVVREGSGRSTRHYLSFMYPGGLEKVNIGEFDTSYTQLGKLLRVYRGRHQAATGHIPGSVHDDTATNS